MLSLRPVLVLQSPHPISIKWGFYFGERERERKASIRIE